MPAQPAGRTVRPVRLDALTGLRWWAAFGVFAHHMTNLAPLPVAEVLSLGAQGVTFFFVLSGFVLTWSADPAVSPATFWWRRFARIWPAHVVALALAVPVFYDVAPDPAQTWVKPFSAVLLLSVGLLQGWSTSPAVLFSGNPAAWTLSCEAFFYALHPGLQRCLRRLGRGAAVAAVVGLPVLAAAFFLARPHLAVLSAVPQPVLRLWEFLLGMALARAVQTGWRPRLPVRASLLVLAGAAAVVVGLPRVAPAVWAAGHGGELTPVVIGTVCGIVILAAALRDLRGTTSWSSSAPLVRLGQLSYAFYLVHATLIYAVTSVVGRAEASWANLGWYAVMLAVSLVVAAALHGWVEKPLERRIRRARDRHDAHGAADAVPALPPSPAPAVAPTSEATPDGR
ncbi:acyltransferase [Georgenia sp. TF02-10]|uniref:acyltransferase family protein n=1 Tax=Georgenia sp. TF02-10 TaxID=2917725 RepID=UPI001FA764B3|nr:acyltransferase [Georgenia sp. TF02-10]UNX55730.1 acyltransferase [Georgenia sp. TF02-10]